MPGLEAAGNQAFRAWFGNIGHEFRLGIERGEFAQKAADINLIAYQPLRCYSFAL